MSWVVGGGWVVGGLDKRTSWSDLHRVRQISNKERNELINIGQQRAGKHVAHHCFDICLTKKVASQQVVMSTKHMLAGNSGSKSIKKEEEKKPKFWCK